MPLRSTTCRRGVASSRSTLSTASSSERGCANRSRYVVFFKITILKTKSRLLTDQANQTKPCMTIFALLRTFRFDRWDSVKMWFDYQIFNFSLFRPFFPPFSVIYQNLKNSPSIWVAFKISRKTGCFFSRRLRIQSRSIQDIFFEEVFLNFKHTYTFSIFFCNFFIFGIPFLFISLV